MTSTSTWSIRAARSWPRWPVECSCAPAGYGVVELLGNGVILISILVRFGMIEAFLRYHFSDTDQERRDALARQAVGFTLLATTAAAALLAAFAGPVSKLILSHRDPT